MVINYRFWSVTFELRLSQLDNTRLHGFCGRWLWKPTRVNHDDRHGVKEIGTAAGQKKPVQNPAEGQEIFPWKIAGFELTNRSTLERFMEKKYLLTVIVEARRRGGSSGSAATKSWWLVEQKAGFFKCINPRQQSAFRLEESTSSYASDVFPKFAEYMTETGYQQMWITL